METNQPQFNFDEWAALYKRDPTEFEYRSKQLLEDTIIQGCPDDLDRQQQMRALLNGINMQLDRVKHPVARLAKMESLLWDHVYKLQAALKGQYTITPKNTTNASIIDITQHKTNQTP